MRVEVELENGQIAAGLFVHKLLSVCVGTCIAAFARCRLRDRLDGCGNGHKWHMLI